MQNSHLPQLCNRSLHVGIGIEAGNMGHADGDTVGAHQRKQGFQILLDEGVVPPRVGLVYGRIHVLDVDEEPIHDGRGGGNMRGKQSLYDWTGRGVIWGRNWIVASLGEKYEEVWGYTFSGMYFAWLYGRMCLRSEGE